jgi:hypothetical protein
MSRPQQIKIFWQGPEGRVLVEITHLKSHARGRDRLLIRAINPEHARLPIDGTGSYDGVYRAAQIHKAGGAARFVESLLQAAARSKTNVAEGRRQPVASDAPASHPVAAERIKSETCKLAWENPSGQAVLLTITHTETFFRRAHIVDISVPPGTSFPLDILSYIATDADIARAGVKGFVESLIAAAENAVGWRKYAARVAQAGLFDERPPSDAPSRPRKSPRSRLKLAAPKR